tara:strand:- start:6909 stop:8816 length:1908 start_codon:yes stop_codon:yes gene_type:complete
MSAFIFPELYHLLWDNENANQVPQILLSRLQQINNNRDLTTIEKNTIGFISNMPRGIQKYTFAKDGGLKILLNLIQSEKKDTVVRAINSLLALTRNGSKTKQLMISNNAHFNIHNCMFLHAGNDTIIRFCLTALYRLVVEQENRLDIAMHVVGNKTFLERIIYILQNTDNLNRSQSMSSAALSCLYALVDDISIAIKAVEYGALETIINYCDRRDRIDSTTSATLASLCAVPAIAYKDQIVAINTFLTMIQHHDLPMVQVYALTGLNTIIQISNNLSMIVHATPILRIFSEVFLTGYPIIQKHILSIIKTIIKIKDGDILIIQHGFVPLLFQLLESKQNWSIVEIIFLLTKNKSNSKFLVNKFEGKKNLKQILDFLLANTHFYKDMKSKYVEYAIGIICNIITAFPLFSKFVLQDPIIIEIIVIACSWEYKSKASQINAEKCLQTMGITPMILDFELLTPLQFTYNEREDNGDIILLSNDDFKIPVHSEVLKSRSPYFSALLETSQMKESNSNIIKIDENQIILTVVIISIYLGAEGLNGNTILNEDYLQPLLAASNFFGLPDLQGWCEKKLILQLSHDSIFDLLKLSDHLNAYRLRFACLIYFMQYYSDLHLKFEDNINDFSTNLQEVINEFIN